MEYRHVHPLLKGELRLFVQENRSHWHLSPDDGFIHIVWNNGSAPALLSIDHVPVQIPVHGILTLTNVQRAIIEENPEALTIFSFNRAFYCIHDHDEEVSCNGIIFVGSQDTPIIPIPEERRAALNHLLEVFIEEFGYEDPIQSDMLLMLLKRLIILCTRLAREQLSTLVSVQEIDLVRQFHLLVDAHFRERHSVTDYAELLFKSPKTIGNIFAQIPGRTPLKIIHERIVYEVKRLLIYSDKTVQEIAYEVGFEDPTPLFKLFKRTTGSSPQQFRDQTRHLHRELLTVPREKSE